MKDVGQIGCDLIRIQAVRDDQGDCSNALAEVESIDHPRVVLTLYFEAKPSVNI